METVKLPEFSDPRGKLSVAEFPGELPFVPRRMFLVYAVPYDNVRGGHAHKELHQFLVCARGSCSVLLDNGTARREFVLDSPTLGLHIRPMIWAAQSNFTPDAVLIVLASDIYRPEDYIRDYDEYLKMLPER